MTIYFVELNTGFAGPLMKIALVETRAVTQINYLYPLKIVSGYFVL